MSRPQNATISAPESRVSARMDVWRTGGTIGAQNGTGRLNGTCKLCREPMEFIRGRFWVHEGGGYLIHSRMVEAERRAAG